MSPESGGAYLESLWDPGHTRPMRECDTLLYRSNLLGSDLRITNFGGGNTSAKITERDPLSGEPVEVLWVKGSGGDLGTMGLDGFATLYMERLRALERLYRGADHEDEMVGYLPHATFDLNPRAASIDTPLHAFVPSAHVDHMHPDAVIAIAAAADGEALTGEIYGDAVGWLPWRRPGFELGLWLRGFCETHPHARGVVLANHGLFTWGDTARECYETTLEVVNTAIGWLDGRTRGQVVFAGAAHAPLDRAARRAVAARLMPELRGRIGRSERKIGHFDDGAATLEFVDSNGLQELAALGTSCPDHFLRTKIRPLVLDFDPSRPALEDTIAGLDAALETYRTDYAAYYARCRHQDSPAMRDANPVVYLIPGVGMITFARDKPTARIAAEFYVNAINVMRGANAVSSYVGLDEQAAFDIEYWLLEEAKLQRMPAPRPMAGRVALVTGGAGGIGRAIAERLLDDGACVVLADVDAPALDSVHAALTGRYGADTVRAAHVDVTDEQQVQAAFTGALVEFGGVDVLVSNAGIASSAPIEDTTIEMWDRNMDILATGYFLVAREAFRALKRQGIGGSIVFVGSKNGLAASPNAAAYCTAKAAEIHLARCLALEGAPHGIRVNVVNPDAVLRGSKIWSGQWREQRAEAYDIEPDALDELYRERSMLKLSVFPEDVAQATYFFVSDMSAKSTGNMLNVDAGNAQAFSR